MAVSAEHVAQILLLRKLADIGDAQRSTIVAIKLAAHLLARARAPTQMRRHVSTTTRAEATSRTAWCVVGHVCGSDVALGGHCVFEGTLCGEMVALADTALDLCVFEFGLLLGFVAFVFGGGFPRRDGTEDDVFCHGGCVGLGAVGLAFFLPEFAPLLALGDAWVYGRFDDGFADAAGGLVAAAIFTDGPGGDGLGAVFVLDDGLGGEGELGVLVVFCPVGAAVE
jgi:hypothetical protein